MSGAVGVRGSTGKDLVSVLGSESRKAIPSLVIPRDVAEERCVDTRERFVKELVVERLFALANTFADEDDDDVPPVVGKLGGGGGGGLIVEALLLVAAEGMPPVTAAGGGSGDTAGFGTPADALFFFAGMNMLWTSAVVGLAHALKQ